MKGRINYPTELQPDKTCEDCQAVDKDDICFLCNGLESCPYQVAKERAKRAELAVTNTAMLLTAANYAGFLDNNQLVIADECDLIEEALMRFVAFEVPKWALTETGIEVPVKAARKNTLLRWLGDLHTGLMDYRDRGETKLSPRRKRALGGLIGMAKRMRQYMIDDIANGLSEEGSGCWFRDYETDTFKLRPVKVAEFGEGLWWRHADRWLLMSGTVVSAEELVESLGWEKEYRVVSVPNTFPAENRPIKLAPIANMTRKADKEREWPRLVYAISQILEHEEGRVLIHAVSYVLTNYIGQHLKARSKRRVIWHENAKGKASALKLFRSVDNAVLISPSLMRGVDLPGDACRIQIIAKCPFPSLGDKQVSLRLHSPGGQLWYTVKTVRDIMQMSGRAVRSDTDRAVTYILDEQFTRNVWSRYKTLFTPGFTEVVKANQDIRWLMPGYREEQSA